MASLAALLAPCPATAVPARPPPDPEAIREAVGAAGASSAPWWSARALSHFLAACVARERGTDDAALAELRLSASYETESAYPRFALASALASSGDEARALREARDALLLDAGHGPSRLLVARLELSRGQAGRALEAVTLALRAMPASVEAHAVLIEALVAAPDLARARAELGPLEMLAQGPAPRGARATLARVAGLVADAASTEGRDAIAQEAYEAALRAEPTGRRRLALAAFLETRGRLAEAEATYGEVPEGDALGVAAAVRRALCRARRGERAAAVEALGRLVQRHPEASEVRQALESLRAAAAAVR